MAVEARHLNSLRPQLVCNNRHLSKGIDENLKMDGTSIGYGGLLLPPLSEITKDQALLPMYRTTFPGSFPTKHPQPQTHNGVSHNTVSLGRKRSRNSIHQSHRNQNYLNDKNFVTSFLGEDISLMIQYQQIEIDNFIAQHVVKIRSEIEEHQRANRRRIVTAVEDLIANKLRAKEEKVDEILNLNRALHEKVKSLGNENQLWRDLAQTNEAAVTTLRTNIEQVMRHRARGAHSESCCSSNKGGEEEDNKVNNAGNWCKKCGKEESCVLLLPCRHLCVCSVCGLGLNICPVCKSTKNASLVVNKC